MSQDNIHDQLTDAITPIATHAALVHAQHRDAKDMIGLLRVFRDMLKNIANNRPEDEQLELAYSNLVKSLNAHEKRFNDAQKLIDDQFIMPEALAMAVVSVEVARTRRTPEAG